MVPINMVNNKAARTFRKVTVRPMPEAAMSDYDVEMQNHDWGNLFSAQSAHEKAVILQSEHASIVEKHFPQKEIRVASDDRPWWTQQLQELHRKKQRIYHKERKSLKWKAMNLKFQNHKNFAKKSFYNRMVKDLIEKDHNQWYNQYKRLTNQK